MQTVSDIFSALGGPSAVARMLGLKPSTASEMKRRGSIPAEYWREIATAARKAGVTVVNVETLAAVHARRAADRPKDGLDDRGAPEGEEEAADPERRTGHFSRHYHVRRPTFATARDIREHVEALRDEWGRR